MHVLAFADALFGAVLNRSTPQGCEELMPFTGCSTVSGSLPGVAAQRTGTAILQGMRGLAPAGPHGKIQDAISSGAASEGTSGSTEGGSKASDPDASVQSSSTTGDEASATARGSTKPFVAPVLQSAEEYYRARGIIAQGQPGTADDAAQQEERTEKEGSKAAAFVEPQLQSAEEYYRQLGLISGEAPLTQGEGGAAEADSAAGEVGEQSVGSNEEVEAEEEPSWNAAASGKGTAQPLGDAAESLESVMAADAMRQGQSAERDPAEPLEIVLGDDAGELPAAWYNDVPRSAGAPEEPFWNAAGKARVIVKRQTAKEGEVGVVEARHLLHVRQR